MSGRGKKKKRRFSAPERNRKSSELLKNAWKSYRNDKKRRLGL